MNRTSDTNFRSIRFDHISIWSPIGNVKVFFFYTNGFSRIIKEEKRTKEKVVCVYP
jgi:hypothetical protein